MYTETAAALDRAAGEPAVRVVLIHGHREVFTSGNDLAVFAAPVFANTITAGRQDTHRSRTRE